MRFTLDGDYYGEIAGSGPFTGRGPKDYRRSAQNIREDVCQRLADDPDLDATGIEIEVDRSEVTLRGSVDSRRAKRAAGQIADGVAGVSDVHNRLRISEPQLP